MLCYIDLEHRRVLKDPERRDAHLALRLGEKLRFEALADMPCLLLSYTSVARGWMERIRPEAILISGNRTEWSAYDRSDLKSLEQFVRDWDRPLIGFCGGHQLIAQAFGGTSGPLGLLPPGEPDPRPDYGPGLIKELGPTEIELVRRDPLLDGLPDRVCVIQDHYWDVKMLPPVLERLAMNETCPVQALRHRERPIYGTQFHPERYSRQCPQGRRLLTNFFSLL